MKIDKVRKLVAAEFGSRATCVKSTDTLPGRPAWELRVGNVLLASRSTPLGALVAARALIASAYLEHEDLLGAR